MSDFATALNCMDGRVQLPVNEAVRSIFGVKFVDTITEAGIVRLLSDDTLAREVESTLARIRISVEKHGSQAIAIAAHDDCAGNPKSEEEQKRQLERAVQSLRQQFPDCRVIGLWVNAAGKADVAVPGPK